VTLPLMLALNAFLRSSVRLLLHDVFGSDSRKSRRQSSATWVPVVNSRPAPARMCVRRGLVQVDQRVARACRGLLRRLSQRRYEKRLVRCWRPM